MLYGSVKKFASQHGATFFGAWLRLRTFFYMTIGGYMKNNQKRVIDITGVELTPGEPTLCLGNGKQGMECCCDECDFYLFCFPEFDQKNEENSVENKVYSCRSYKKGEKL